MKEKLRKIIFLEGSLGLSKSKNDQSKINFSPKKNDHSAQNRNNFSLDSKFTKKKTIDIKISYIGDIKNEFGIYSNKLSKIEQAAESFAKLRHKIKIIKKMKFQNRILRKLDCKFQEESIPNFDVKDCLRDYNKIYFKPNKPIFEKIKQKKIENQKNKLIRKCSTYLINYNNRNKSKYLCTKTNFFNNNNKYTIKRQNLMLSPSRKNPKNKRNNGDFSNINNFTNSESFVNKKKISLNNNSYNNINKSFFSGMLKVKKISNFELNEIHTKLYGGKTFKNSDKNLIEKNQPFNKKVNLTYYKQNNKKTRDIGTNTSSQNVYRINDINTNLRNKDRLIINDFNNRSNYRGIILKCNDNDKIILTDFKNMCNSSSSSEQDDKK